MSEEQQTPNKSYNSSYIGSTKKRAQTPFSRRTWDLSPRVSSPFRRLADSTKKRSKLSVDVSKDAKNSPIRSGHGHGDELMDWIASIKHRATTALDKEEEEERKFHEEIEKERRQVEAQNQVNTDAFEKLGLLIEQGNHINSPARTLELSNIRLGTSASSQLEADEAESESEDSLYEEKPGDFEAPVDQDEAEEVIIGDLEDDGDIEEDEEDAAEEEEDYSQQYFDQDEEQSYDEQESNVETQDMDHDAYDSEGRLILPEESQFIELTTDEEYEQKEGEEPEAQKYDPEVFNETQNLEYAPTAQYRSMYQQYQPPVAQNQYTLQNTKLENFNEGSEGKTEYEEDEADFDQGGYSQESDYVMESEGEVEADQHLREPFTAAVDNAEASDGFDHESDYGRNDSEEIESSNDQSVEEVGSDSEAENFELDIDPSFQGAEEAKEQEKVEIPIGNDDRDYGTSEAVDPQEGYDQVELLANAALGQVFEGKIKDQSTGVDTHGYTDNTIAVSSLEQYDVGEYENDGYDSDSIMEEQTDNHPEEAVSNENEDIELIEDDDSEGQLINEAGTESDKEVIAKAEPEKNEVSDVIPIVEDEKEVTDAPSSEPATVNDVEDSPHKEEEAEIEPEEEYQEEQYYDSDDEPFKSPSHSLFGSLTVDEISIVQKDENDEEEYDAGAYDTGALLDEIDRNVGPEKQSTPDDDDASNVTDSDLVEEQGSDTSDSKKKVDEVVRPSEEQASEKVKLWDNVFGSEIGLASFSSIGNLQNNSALSFSAASADFEKSLTAMSNTQPNTTNGKSAGNTPTEEKRVESQQGTCAVSERTKAGEDGANEVKHMNEINEKSSVKLDPLDNSGRKIQEDAAIQETLVGNISNAHEKMKKTADAALEQALGESSEKFMENVLDKETIKEEVKNVAPKALGEDPEKAIDDIIEPVNEHLEEVSSKVANTEPENIIRDAVTSLTEEVENVATRALGEEPERAVNELLVPLKSHTESITTKAAELEPGKIVSDIVHSLKEQVDNTAVKALGEEPEEFAEEILVADVTDHLKDGADAVASTSLEEKPQDAFERDEDSINAFNVAAISNRKHEGEVFSESIPKVAEEFVKDAEKVSQEAAHILLNQNGGAVFSESLPEIAQDFVHDISSVGKEHATEFSNIGEDLKETVKEAAHTFSEFTDFVKSEINDAVEIPASMDEESKQDDREHNTAAIPGALTQPIEESNKTETEDHDSFAAPVIPDIIKNSVLEAMRVAQEIQEQGENFVEEPSKPQLNMNFFSKSTKPSEIKNVPEDGSSKDTMEIKYSPDVGSSKDQMEIKESDSGSVRKVLDEQQTLENVIPKKRKLEESTSSGIFQKLRRFASFVGSELDQNLEDPLSDVDVTDRENTSANDKAREAINKFNDSVEDSSERDSQEYGNDTSVTVGEAVEHFVSIVEDQIEEAVENTLTVDEINRPDHGKAEYSLSEMIKDAAIAVEEEVEAVVEAPVEGDVDENPDKAGDFERKNALDKFVDSIKEKVKESTSIAEEKVEEMGEIPVEDATPETKAENGAVEDESSLMEDVTNFVSFAEEQVSNTVNAPVDDTPDLEESEKAPQIDIPMKSTEDEEASGSGISQIAGNIVQKMEDEVEKAVEISVDGGDVEADKEEILDTSQYVTEEVADQPENDEEHSGIHVSSESEIVKDGDTSEGGPIEDQSERDAEKERNRDKKTTDNTPDLLKETPLKPPTGSKFDFSQLPTQKPYRSPFKRAYDFLFKRRNNQPSSDLQTLVLDKSDVEEEPNEPSRKRQKTRQTKQKSDFHDRIIMKTRSGKIVGANSEADIAEAKELEQKEDELIDLIAHGQVQSGHVLHDIAVEHERIEEHHNDEGEHLGTQNTDAGEVKEKEVEEKDVKEEKEVTPAPVDKDLITEEPASPKTPKTPKSPNSPKKARPPKSPATPRRGRVRGKGRKSQRSKTTGDLEEVHKEEEEEKEKKQDTSKKRASSQSKRNSKIPPKSERQLRSRTK